jgi:hypothetical protein
MAELVRAVVSGLGLGSQGAVILIRFTVLSSRAFCHPEQREGPGFLLAPAILPAPANTQVPRVARDDNCLEEARHLASQLGAQHADHVVGGDDAGEPALFVHDRESLQVVLVEQFRDLVFLDALLGLNERLLR